MCSGVPLGAVTPSPLCRRGLLAWMLQYFGEERGGQDTPLACVPMHPPRDPEIVPEHPQQGDGWGLWDPHPPPHSVGDSPITLVGWGRGGEEVGMVLGGGASRREPRIHPVLFAAQPC